MCNQIWDLGFNLLGQPRNQFGQHVLLLDFGALLSASVACLAFRVLGCRTLWLRSYIKGIFKAHVEAKFAS